MDARGKKEAVKKKEVPKKKDAEKQHRRQSQADADNKFWAECAPRLQQWQQDNRLSGTEVARTLGRSQSHWSRVIHGASGTSPRTLAALAEHFNLDIHWLLTGKPYDARRIDRGHAALPADMLMPTGYNGQDMSELREVVREVGGFRQLLQLARLLGSLGK